MLTFDAATHTYRFDGQVVPSVTQILAPLTDLSKIPRDVLERKRQIGTWVHEAIELDLAGNLDEDSIEDEWRGYFNGWRKFQAESGFVMLDNEAKVYSKKYGYAGTLDLFGSLPMVKEALIDTKCVAVLYPSVGPQTAAYAEAHGVPKAKRFALQLKPDGKYELHPCTARNDLNVFLAALTLFNWEKSCNS